MKTFCNVYTYLLIYIFFISLFRVDIVKKFSASSWTTIHAIFKLSFINLHGNELSGCICMYVLYLQMLLLFMDIIQFCSVSYKFLCMLSQIDFS